VGKQVLGKGLGALIPAGDDHVEHQQMRRILLDQITPNPVQPRRDFSEARLQELADSFRKNGVIQPLVVRRSGAGFVIIAGERRYRAARLAELEHVPALVMDDVDDNRALELALVENIQREDLNPIELAEAYRSLIDRCELTQNELSARVGKSRTAVANQLRLLGLPESIKQLVRERKLTEGHARTLLGLAGEGAMLALAERMMSGEWSVRDAEKEASRKKQSRARSKSAAKLPILMEIETELKRLLGTSVRIVPGRRKGRIEVDYYGDDDLERLLDLMRKSAV
jgi:ParB family chromosome partitioning protein